MDEFIKKNSWTMAILLPAVLIQTLVFAVIMMPLSIFGGQKGRAYVKRFLNRLLGH